MSDWRKEFCHRKSTSDTVCHKINGVPQIRVSHLKCEYVEYLKACIKELEKQLKAIKETSRKLAISGIEAGDECYKAADYILNLQAENTRLREVSEGCGEAFVSLRGSIASQAKDFSLDHRDAWLYWILFGWDEGEDEILSKHGWKGDNLKRLRKYHDSVCMAIEVLESEVDNE